MALVAELLPLLDTADGLLLLRKLGHTEDARTASKRCVPVWCQLLYSLPETCCSLRGTKSALPRGGAAVRSRDSRGR